MATSFAAARDFLLEHRTDYQTAYRDYQPPQLTHFNWALDHFDKLAAGNTATALWIADDAGEVKVSFAELAARSNRLANHWRALGVKRGDRVLLMLGNIVPLWEIMLAAIKLGAVVIPATTQLTEDDIADRVARGAIKHVVTTGDLAPKLAKHGAGLTRIAIGAVPAGWLRYEDYAAASPDFAPEGATLATDPLLLYFTSGTTARPKLVLHSHQSYPVGHLSTMYWLGLQPGDIHLNISSPGWAKHAWSCFFAPWNAGATVFIFNQPRFAAKPLLDAIAKAKVTTLCAPPTVWRMFVQEDLASWKMSFRELIGAGEPLNPEIIDRVKAAWGITIRDGYGQTETTAQIGNSPGQVVKPGSMGRPLPGYKIALLDADEKPAEEGQIAILFEPRPIGLMQGYQGAGGVADPIQGSVYLTGDVASRDADGYLTFVGRADDVFKASDYRISPFELESVLIEHPAVAEAAVVPSPDPVRLAVPKAFLALRTGHTADRATALSIFQHLKAHLAPYKRIRRLQFADLPKTISGKIRRVELRGNENALREGGTGRATLEFWEEDFPELR